MTDTILIFRGYDWAMAATGWFEYEEADYRASSAFKAFAATVRKFITDEPQTMRQIKEAMRQAHVPICERWFADALEQSGIEIIKRYPCDVYRLATPVATRASDRDELGRKAWNGSRRHLIRRPEVE